MPPGTVRRVRTPPPLWLIYLLGTLPIVAFLTIATPPMQVADENAHFLRAVQLGQGGLLAQSRPEVLNGLLPGSAVRFARRYGRAPAPAGMAAWRRDAAPAGRAGWTSPPTAAFFGNTAIYPPVFYLPAALAIDVARLCGTRLAASLEAARIAQGLASLALATLALGIGRRGPLTLFLLLALPMTLSLFGSCSQEGPMLATAALAAAWLSRRDARAPGSAAGWIGIGLLLGLLGAAKLPSILLGLLPACLGPACGRRGAGLAASALALLVSLGWLAAGAIPLMGGLHRAGVSPDRQMRLVLTHPLHAALVAARTLHVFGPTLVREAVGVLGLLDTVLPASFYAAALLCLFCALGAELWPLESPWGSPQASPLRLLLPRGPRRAVAAVLAGSVAVIFALFYLVWTPVGGGLIEGVQGRYLLPPLMFAVLLLPHTGPADVPAAQRRLAACFVLLVWCVVPATVLTRYA